jgi:hypothetical protein
MRPTRFLSNLALVALLAGVVNCAGDGPTGLADEPTPSPLLGGDGGLLGTGIGEGLLACKPLPYAAATRTIGPEGGSLKVGPHTLTVPAGSLTAPVTITAEAPVDRVNSVRLSPEGLQFVRGKPAVLTLSYANCPLTGQLLPKRIAYTTDALAILSYLLSVDNLLTKQVSGKLEHFSRYAVAW